MNREGGDAILYFLLLRKRIHILFNIYFYCRKKIQPLKLPELKIIHNCVRNHVDTLTQYKSK